MPVSSGGLECFRVRPGNGPSLDAMRMATTLVGSVSTDSRSVVGEIQDVSNGLRDLAQDCRRQAQQRPLNQATVIDGTELVDE